MSKPTARQIIADLAPAEVRNGCVCNRCLLASRVEQVLALHIKGLAVTPHCQECMVPWPCPTVRILNGEE